MFGFLKNLLGKRAAAPAPTSPLPGEAVAAVPSGPAAAGTPQKNGAGSASNGNGNGRPPAGPGIKLPLPPILSGLPAELHKRVTLAQVKDLSIVIGLDRILPQLARGQVKISFGELRQAAPQVFTTEADRDQVQVFLPLGLIVPQLSPGVLVCRRVQRRVEIPEEIHSAFDLQGNGLTFSTEPIKPESAPTPPRHSGPPAAPQLPPIPCPAALSPLDQVPPARGRILSAPTPPPPGLPLASPALAGSGRGVRDLSPVEPAAPVAAPIPMPIPMPKAPAAAAGPSPAVAAPNPPPAAAAPKANGEPAPALTVGLSLLAANWPEAIRKEIVQFNLGEARLALPHEAIEKCLKSGRIQFNWQTVRSWITPPKPPVASAQDQVVLELPLKIIAPLFLVRLRESAKLQRKVTVDASIPNLFFGLPQPDASAAAPEAAAKTSDTNFFAREQVVNSSPGTKFVAKLATPNEVVSRAAALDGVAGALVALPDGLLVASRLAPDLNADTLAAFLPQIFNKVSQSTKELRMGELNNLHFTVGNIPWKIFRVNAIYFAAFGRAGGPLPTAQLAALAAELDHRPK